MSSRIMQIVAIMVNLDPKNPDHWLKDGETPDIGTLEELSGLEDITADERNEAVEKYKASRVEGNTPSKPPLTSPDLEKDILLIAKTMVRVKEGEEQRAWGSSFKATRVKIEDPDTGEMVEKMVLLGSFPRNAFEHESLIQGKRVIIFRGTIL